MKTRLLILFLFTFTTVYADNATLSPPTSLAQWYKPDNKRNVWQHNMFKLRREMQAIEQYMPAKDPILLQKWTQRFSQHYRKISDMMPEWSDSLDLIALTQLQQAVQDNNKTDLHSTLKKIKQSCKSCHIDYRADVAFVYRAPDFSQIKMENNEKTVSYRKGMKQLTADMNKIIIALDDKQFDNSLTALTALETGIQDLGKSCKQCHQEDESRDFYLGKKTDNLLKELKQAIKNKDPQAGHKVGAVAVRACARCHGVHRILSDLNP